MINRLRTYLVSPVSVAPLVVFRMVFALLMLFSLCRFVLKGWVHSMYIAPKFFFPYQGLEWVKPLGACGMYLVFALMILACAGILLGAFYRLSTILFFVLFTYVELIDKTNYLNHYYFISLVSFIMIFLPCARAFSVDALRRGKEASQVPRFFLLLPQAQMFIVYFFAGVAKLNSEWLLHAEPLKTWLPAFSHYPVIGPYMEAGWVAYLFCWFGAAYDLTIGFLLFSRRMVKYAYVLVLIFHLATSLFFNIGMFPYIMIAISTIFFLPEWHQRILEKVRSIVGYRTVFSGESPSAGNWVVYTMMVFFFVQLAMPFRYLFYQGSLFWTEQGYRFSWRVMLMEKAGAAFFYVTDKTGRRAAVDNREHLSFMQEKMMATQPDMMVDYARMLKKKYEERGFIDAKVNVESYVTLNRKGSREFIDPSVDLALQSNSVFESKTWVRSY